MIWLCVLTGGVLIRLRGWLNSLRVVPWRCVLWLCSWSNTARSVEVTAQVTTVAVSCWPSFGSLFSHVLGLISAQLPPMIHLKLNNRRSEGVLYFHFKILLWANFSGRLLRLNPVLWSCLLLRPWSEHWSRPPIRWSSTLGSKGAAVRLRRPAPPPARHRRLLVHELHLLDGVRRALTSALMYEEDACGDARCLWFPAGGAP